MNKQNMKCVCGKTAKFRVNLDLEGNLCVGWKCDSCGEAYYTPEQAQAILSANKTKKEEVD